MTILHCAKCKKYTLEPTCCGIKTQTVRPAKFSPDDKWGKYRREFKRQNSYK